MGNLVGCVSSSIKQSQHQSPHHSNTRLRFGTWYCDWKCDKCGKEWTAECGTGSQPDFTIEGKRYRGR